MLVHPDRVEAELLAVLELVEIAVVELVPLLRVEVAVGQRHPDPAVLAPGREVEVGVRHQMKEDYLHAKRTTSSQNSSIFSTCGRCPQRSRMLSSALGSRRFSSCAMPTGRMRSCAPQTMLTGTSMRCSHLVRCGSCSRGSHARRAAVWRCFFRQARRFGRLPPPT